MNRKCQKDRTESEQEDVNTNLVCDVCGRFGALKFGKQTLCADCYIESGSCCPEFGKDDLWTFPDKD